MLTKYLINQTITNISKLTTDLNKTVEQICEIKGIQLYVDYSKMASIPLSKEQENIYFRSIENICYIISNSIDIKKNSIDIKKNTMRENMEIIISAAPHVKFIKSYEIDPSYLDELKNLDELKKMGDSEKSKFIAKWISKPFVHLYEYKDFKGVLIELAKSYGTINEHKIPVMTNINKKRIGISNNGNTCFMNSTLQMLNSIPELVHYLDEYIRHLNYEAPPKKLLRTQSKDSYEDGKYILYHLNLALQKLQTIQNGAVNISTCDRDVPTAFNSFKPNSSGFGINKQADPDEFLRMITEALVNVADNDMMFHRIKELFSFRLGKRCVCENIKNKSTKIGRMSGIYDVVLPCPIDGIQNPTVQQCVDSYFKLENMKNGDPPYCDNQKGVVIYQQYDFEYPAPLYFIITLKRERMNGVKIMDKVAITPVIEIKLSPTDIVRYDIMGAVVHGGNTSNEGHYVYHSINKIPGGSGFEIDIISDSTVMLNAGSMQNEYLLTGSKILLYKKQIQN